MPRKASDKGDTKEKEMPTNDNLVLKEKITIGFCVAIAAVLIIMEGYVIMRLPDQFLLIGFLVIPLAIDIYVMVNSVINLSLINNLLSDKTSLLSLYAIARCFVKCL